MAAYSMLLRQRVVAACDARDGARAQIAEALRAIRPGDILGWFAQGGDPTGQSTDTVKRKPHQR